MKDIIKLYAKYNLENNNQMINIIENNIEEPWNHPLNGYYFKTLGKILEHIYKADNNWMCYILKCISNVIKIDNHIELIENESVLFIALNQYKDERKELDQIIINFSEEIQEVNINYLSEAVNNGKSVQWKPIIHMFNHQTHHRGQISNVLDELNIENDYSNIISL